MSIPASVSALMEMAKQVNAYFDGPLTNALLTGTDTEWEYCHSQHQQQLHKLRGLAKMATLCGTTTTIMAGRNALLDRWPHQAGQRLADRWRVPRLPLQGRGARGPGGHRKI